MDRTLPSYMMPASFMFLDDMPLTPNGKLDRGALPEPEFRAGPSAGRVRPRTAVEAELLQIWEESLGVRDIGLTDNFFDLGGTSLLAASMFSLVEKRFGPTPISVLFESPTVEQMARRIESSAPWSGWRCLVAVQSTGGRPPLFVVPLVNGNALSLVGLARAMGPDQPIYGLQSLGLDGVQAPLGRIEDIAAYFLDEVRTLQPSGPYHLAGFCVGGVVAYEMARQLHALGSETALLALLDSWPPHHSKSEDRLLPYETPLLWALRSAMHKMVSLEVWRWPAFLLRKVPRLARRILGARDEYDSLSFARMRVVTANLNALERYRHEPYDGRILFVAASEHPLEGTADPRLVWLKSAHGGCELRYVPAQNAGQLVRSPYVERVADHVNEALALLQTASSCP